MGLGRGCLPWQHCHVPLACPILSSTAGSSTRMELLAWFLPRRKHMAVYISDKGPFLFQTKLNYLLINGLNPWSLGSGSQVGEAQAWWEIILSPLQEAGSLFWQEQWQTGQGSKGSW